MGYQVHFCSGIIGNVWMINIIIIFGNFCQRDYCIILCKLTNTLDFHPHHSLFLYLSHSLSLSLSLSLTHTHTHTQFFWSVAPYSQHQQAMSELNLSAKLNS